MEYSLGIGLITLKKNSLWKQRQASLQRNGSSLLEWLKHQRRWGFLGPSRSACDGKCDQLGMQRRPLAPMLMVIPSMSELCLPFVSWDHGWKGFVGQTSAVSPQSFAGSHAKRLQLCSALPSATTGLRGACSGWRLQGIESWRLKAIGGLYPQKLTKQI